MSKKTRLYTVEVYANGKVRIRQVRASSREEALLTVLLNTRGDDVSARLTGTKQGATKQFYYVEV